MALIPRDIVDNRTAVEKIETNMSLACAIYSLL